MALYFVWREGILRMINKFIEEMPEAARFVLFYNIKD
jgi:hypothetical protein